MIGRLYDKASKMAASRARNLGPSWDKTSFNFDRKADSGGGGVDGDPRVIDRCRRDDRRLCSS